MARRCSTICLPICKEDYQQLVDSPIEFRQWIDRAFQTAPELFPSDFQHGYTLKDLRRSKRLQLRIRRIQLKANKHVFSVRPSSVMPYMTAWTDDVEKALFLRAFGVPFWALADEHHQTRDGQKNYIATTVGDGCCLGAALAQTAGAEDLQAAYGVFKQEAQEHQKDYQPKTVNTDGWASTQQAWQGLFSLVVILRCFLHGWLAIRSRGKLSEGFETLSEKV